MDLQPRERQGSLAQSRYSRTISISPSPCLDARRSMLWTIRISAIHAGNNALRVQSISLQRAAIAVPPAGAGTCRRKFRCDSMPILRAVAGGALQNAHGAVCGTFAAG